MSRAYHRGITGDQYNGICMGPKWSMHGNKFNNTEVGGEGGGAVMGDTNDDHQTSSGKLSSLESHP